MRTTLPGAASFQSLNILESWLHRVSLGSGAGISKKLSTASLANFVISIADCACGSVFDFGFHVWAVSTLSRFTRKLEYLLN
ncbi:hypothetical protein MRB53_035576 [Persea americana]|uniref:Uncharacterized protein n=1 Tax=Persea americana TaxID=3435 RepID=A0ACC2K518_PERAE|nr:hypothetical protein MRB53_035576 [Persea americana]